MTFTDSVVFLQALSVLLFKKVYAHPLWACWNMFNGPASMDAVRFKV